MAQVIEQQIAEYDGRKILVETIIAANIVRDGLTLRGAKRVATQFNRRQRGISYPRYDDTCTYAAGRGYGFFAGDGSRYRRCYVVIA